MRFTVGSEEHLMALVQVALLAIRTGKVTGLGGFNQLGTWAEEAQRCVNARLQPATKMLEPGFRCPACAREITEQAWGGLRRLGFVGSTALSHRGLQVHEIRECVCTGPIARPTELPVTR